MKRRAVLVVFALLLATFAVARGPVTLLYRFDTDQPFRWRIDYTGSGTYTRGVAATPQPVTVEFHSRATVRADRAAPPPGSPPGNYLDLQLRMDGFTHVRALGAETERVTFGPGLYTFKRGEKVLADLADPVFAKTELGKEVRQYSAPITLTIDARGNIFRVAGMERFDDLSPQVALRDLLATSPPRLPDAPVGDGATWDARVPLRLPYCPESACAVPVKFTAVGRVRTQGFGGLRLKVEGGVDLPRGAFTYPDAYDRVTGAETRIRAFRQTIAGEVDFAPEEGMPIAAKLRVRTRTESVYAYAELGLVPNEVPVVSDLAIDSELRYDGDRPPHGLWEWVRSWFD